MSEHAYSAQTIAQSRAGLTHRDGRPRPPTGPGRPLLVALACVLALAATWSIAELIPAAHVRDARLLGEFTRLDKPHIDRLASFLVHLMNPDLFILWGISLLAYAISRERPRVALAVVAVMGFAPLTSEKLKPLLAHSHDKVGAVQINPASWPSGHSTAAMALVLCAILCAPAALRPLAIVLGALFAGAVGVSLLILAWHMPSDVIGGYLIASLWMALAVAVLKAAEQRWPTGKPL
ncbi:MAG TPA: phosphatase PAP2 family protein [Solirubrobacteraceae bacterium]|jgi:membrane-associated phospholipid phosphatase